MPVSIAYIENHFSHKIKLMPSECWVWLGATNSSQSSDHSPYGHVGLNGKYPLIHRVVYEAFKGPIPEGFEIDHLCRNTLCVNVSHLEAVTKAENNFRKANRSCKDFLVTLHDHNVRLNSRGHCKECVAAYARDYRKRTRVL